MPKFVTFAALKGGVGKSTLCYELGVWLAAKNLKVLFIDFDLQHNLTDRTKLDDPTGNADGILLGKSVKIRHIPNVTNADIIEGAPLMDAAEDEIFDDKDAYLKLLKWAMQNKKQLAKYDYILIDTHPGFTRSVQNAVLMSDLVISPIIPGAESYNSHYDLAARIRLFSKQASKRLGREMGKIKIIYVLNQVHKGTLLSRALTKNVNSVAIFPYRELFKQVSVAGSDLVNLKKHKGIYNANKSFFTTVNREFSKIKRAIDRS